MGSVGSRFSRPLKNWNVEARAHKLISKNKIRPPPTFKSVEKQRQLVDELYPEYKKNADTKNRQLDERLKQVFVTSDEKAKEIDSRYDSDKPLPKEKTVPEPFEYGFFEPHKPKPGKLTLRQVIEVLQKHSKDPVQNNTKTLAKEYEMDPKNLENIFNSVSIYKIIDIKYNHNRDSVAKPLRISTKTGITVLHTEGKKKKVERKDEQVRHWKEIPAGQKNNIRVIKDKEINNVKEIKDK